MQYGLSTALHSVHTTGRTEAQASPAWAYTGCTPPRRAAPRASPRSRRRPRIPRQAHALLLLELREVHGDRPRVTSTPRFRRTRPPRSSLGKFRSPLGVLARPGRGRESKRRPIELEHPSGLGFVVDRARVGGRWLAESRGGQSQSLAAFTGSHSRSPPPPPPPRPFVLMPARRVLRVKGSEPMQHGSHGGKGAASAGSLPFASSPPLAETLSSSPPSLPPDPPVPQREILPLAHRRRDSPPHRFPSGTLNPAARFPSSRLPLVSSVGGYPTTAARCENSAVAPVSRSASFTRFGNNGARFTCMFRRDARSVSPISIPTCAP